MAENLVRRVKRLVSGSVNLLVDAMENANAESVMREAIREVDRTIDEVRDELARVTGTRYQTSRHIAKTKAKHEELAVKARVAAEQGRDDLAEAAISRQLDLEAQLPVLEQTLADTAAQQTELESYVAALNGRKREMEADLAAYLSARETTATLGGEGTRSSTIGGAERQVERAQAAFDRAMGAPGGPQKADRETAAKLVELEKVTRTATIADRLAAIKSAKRA